MRMHAAVLSGICVTDSVWVYVVGRGLARAGSTVESHRYVDWSVIPLPYLWKSYVEI